MKSHAFVAMPFGVKKDSQGEEIDSNRVNTGGPDLTGDGWRTGGCTWVDGEVWGDIFLIVCAAR